MATTESATKSGDATAIRQTSCPLDCPDSCRLLVTGTGAESLQLTGADGEVTDGYICGKVRHFGEHVYGPDRLQYPMLRTGAKGEAAFRRATWDEALEVVVRGIHEARDRFGPESILTFSYGGSNGLLTHDALDARLFRRLKASRLGRTVCAAAAGRASLELYGKMPGVAYADYPEAQLIVIWGANPSASGIHLVPHVKRARERGARLVVIDPRRTPLAAQADLHLAIRPGTDLPCALAVIRELFAQSAADHAFLREHTRGGDELRRRAEPWTIEKAAREAGIDEADLSKFCEWYAQASPALIRCGWGPERNRNGGSAIAAILALPAVAGKFGVRGGGFTMSNKGAWSWPVEEVIGEPEPPTRIINMNRIGRDLLDPELEPPLRLLFVYNANPLATVPHQNAVRKGLSREDLLTIVFDQVMTDTARYADVVLPATTFLEHHELRNGYGSYWLQESLPVIERVGESRPNAEVFGELLHRLGLAREGEPETTRELRDRHLRAQPARVATDLGADGQSAPECGTCPVQFVDVFPRTPTGKVELFPAALDAETRSGLYVYEEDPGSERFPLALISPSTSKTISSTLGQLVQEPARVSMHPRDAETRGITVGATVRVFNELGEVVCGVRVTEQMLPGVVEIPKGIWCRHTENGNTSNALVPDTFTDFAEGACFNDARVQVEPVDP